MRVAVVGLGGIGQVHIKAIRETKNELVAVCDVDIGKLSNFTGIKCYTDYLVMLDEVKPDVIHICTPHYLHTEMIIAGLQRNINVLCEKPLCIDEKDIPLIIDAEKNSKAQLGVCFQNRYNPSSIFVKEYLKDKEILSAHGRMMWHRDAQYYNQAAWRGNREQEGGGVLINQALHTLDLLQWFMKMPQSVVGWCSNISLQNVIDVEDSAVVLCKGEREYSLSATNAAEKDYPVEIVIKTTSETIRLLSQGVYINGKFYDCESIDVIYGKQVYGSGHNGLICDFYECISTGRKFPIDGFEGAKAVRIVLTAYASQGIETVCK